MFNAVMWALFVRALNRCSSTVEAAAVNSASNFFFTVQPFSLQSKRQKCYPVCMAEIISILKAINCPFSALDHGIGPKLANSFVYKI